MRWIWGTWLPSAPFESVGGPDFERYPPGFDPRKPGMYIDIAVPVRRRAS